jgi:protein-tyrosine-phosphatase
MYSVLFVCTANQCRSPMAEGLWRSIVAARYPDDEWEIASAGTWAVKGLRAMPLAVQTLQEHGLDGRGHRSQPVDAGLLHAYRLILVMTRNHKEALQIEFPRARDRVFLLSEMVGQVYDIDDPVVGGPADYRRTAAQLRDLLEAGAECIRSLAQDAGGAG